MKRRVGTFAAALVLTLAPSASAHHSHPLTYDWCRSITVEGRVERVEFKNPHSIIVVRLDDGAAYTVDWMPVDRLRRTRILESAMGALAFGARVSVTGAPIRAAAEIKGFFPDFTGEVNPRMIDPRLIRVGETFTWALPQSPAPANCAGIPAPTR